MTNANETKTAATPKLGRPIYSRCTHCGLRWSAFTIYCTCGCVNRVIRCKK